MKTLFHLLSLRLCLFLRKDSGEKRKLRERSIFFSLEHFKKEKGRKNLMGPTLKTFPREYGEKGWETPLPLLFFIYVTILMFFLREMLLFLIFSGSPFHFFLS